MFYVCVSILKLDFFNINAKYFITWPGQSVSVVSYKP